MVLHQSINQIPRVFLIYHVKVKTKFVVLGLCFSSLIHITFLAMGSWALGPTTDVNYFHF
jgi:hypothetical protein